MNILTYSVGFIEIPNLVTLNIYTVGCKHACPNCHTIDLQNFNHPKKISINIAQFLEIVDKHKNLIQGVCWLGGDPLEQVDDLKGFSAVVQYCEPDLTNIIYTGYLFEEIDETVLHVADIIVDGKFNGYKIDDERTNQKIYFKTKDDTWLNISYKELQERIKC